MIFYAQFPIYKIVMHQLLGMYPWKSGKKNSIKTYLNTYTYFSYLRLDNNLPYYQFDPPTKPLISDRGICSFGMSRNNIQQGVIWIRAEHRQPDTNLERLVVRFYKLVTDVSLRHLSTCAPKLKFV
jgi:hypothetical protein